MKDYALIAIAGPYIPPFLSFLHHNVATRLGEIFTGLIPLEYWPQFAITPKHAVDLRVKVEELGAHIAAVMTPPATQEDKELHGQVYAELFQIRRILISHMSGLDSNSARLLRLHIESLEKMMRKFGSLTYANIIHLLHDLNLFLAKLN